MVIISGSPWTGNTISFGTIWFSLNTTELNKYKGVFSEKDSAITEEAWSFANYNLDDPKFVSQVADAKPAPYLPGHQANLDVIKTEDCIIDPGPEGGRSGQVMTHPWLAPFRF